MNTSIIILCAGKSERWKNHLEMPKQLVPVNGLPLLHRTIRLVKKFRENNITIVTHRSDLIHPDCKSLNPEKREWIVASLLSSKNAWGGKTVVLLGDVYYSEKAMKQILAAGSGINFFGCDKAQKTRNEIFAFSFDGSDAVTLESHILRAVKEAEDRKKTIPALKRFEKVLRAFGLAKIGPIWNGLRRFCNRKGGVPFWQLGKLWSIHNSLSKECSNCRFWFIHDETMDIDDPADYETLLSNLSEGEH